MYRSVRKSRKRQHYLHATADLCTLVHLGMLQFAARAPAECRVLYSSKVLYQWRAIKMRIDLRGPVPLVIPRLLPDAAGSAERGTLFACIATQTITAQSPDAT